MNFITLNPIPRAQRSRCSPLRTRNPRTRISRRCSLSSRQRAGWWASRSATMPLLTSTPHTFNCFGTPCCGRRARKRNKAAREWRHTNLNGDHKVENHPHPGPLPSDGRGRIIRRLCSKPSRRIDRTVIKKSQDVRWLFPLPSDGRGSG